MWKRFEKILKNEFWKFQKLLQERYNLDFSSVPGYETVFKLCPFQLGELETTTNVEKRKD